MQRLDGYTGAHPTLTRVWCRQGRRGQRPVEVPGANDKVYSCGIVAWCTGWFDGAQPHAVPRQLGSSHVDTPILLPPWA